MPRFPRPGGSPEDSVLVFAYGNPSRGDDALGPLLLEYLAARVRAADWRHVELVGDYQLQIEHALDLCGRRLVLFADAGVACPRPFGFEEIAARRDPTYTTHAMSPHAVLDVYEKTLHLPPPPTFLLTIRGEAFELGAPVTAAARRHLEAACAFADVLCADARVEPWRARTYETAMAPALP